METTDLLEENNEKDHVSWINHGLVKAFVAGFVLGIGLLVSSLMVNIPGVDNLNTNSDVLITISYFFLSLVSAFLILRYVNRWLKRFGFEGVKLHQNTKLDFPKLFSATLGCLLSQFLFVAIGGAGTLIMVIGSVYWGETKFKILAVTAVIGILAFFALSYRVSHNQAEAQQETR
ncbi:MAG: hypothetical protein P8183_18350 [Anaerolineae bacterium]